MNTKRLMLVAKLCCAALVLGACETEPEKPTGKNPGVKPVGLLDSEHNFARTKGLENLYDSTPAWWSETPEVSGNSANVCSVGAAGDLAVAYDLAMRNARASGREAMHVTPDRVEVLNAGVSRTPGGDFVVKMRTRCDAPIGAVVASAPARAVPKVQTTAVASAPVVAYAAPVPAAVSAPAPVTTRNEPVPGDLTEGAPAWYAPGTSLANGRYTVAVRRDARSLIEGRRFVLEAGRDELDRVCAGSATDVRTLQTAAQKLADGTWRAYASMLAAQPEVSK